MLRAAAILVLALVGLANVHTRVGAEEPTVSRADILWAGIYQGDIAGTVPQPRTAMGRTNNIVNIVKLEATTTVPARLGVNFGIEYRLSGAPAGAHVPITVVVILPKVGLLNPATRQRTFREEWSPAHKQVGEISVLGYALEQAWEVVPGPWTFEIWWGGDKLGEQTFCLLGEKGSDPGAADKAKDEPCHSAATA